MQHLDGDTMTETTKPMQIKINTSRCGGHARCREEAPEVFDYDSRTNKACVRDGADVNAHRKAVELAIRGCPERAITWSDAGDPRPNK